MQQDQLLNTKGHLPILQWVFLPNKDLKSSAEAAGKEHLLGLTFSQPCRQSALFYKTHHLLLWGLNSTTHHQSHNHSWTQTFWEMNKLCVTVQPSSSQQFSADPAHLLPLLSSPVHTTASPHVQSDQRIFIHQFHTQSVCQAVLFETFQHVSA